MRYLACPAMRSFTMHVFLIVLLMKICYMSASSTTGSKESRDDAQKSNIHRVVSKVIGELNAGDVELRGDGRWSSVGVQPVFTGRSRFPPRHIYRLYERYRNGQIVHGADTVRSVNAEIGR